MKRSEFSTEVAVTQLLSRWKAGDRSVEEELIAAVYPYIKAMAGANLRRVGHGLMQTTELANEAFIRLQSQQQLDWKNRAHFLAVIAAITRNVVVDLVREQMAGKRGGGAAAAELTPDSPAQSTPDTTAEQLDWMALDQALRSLAEHDPSCARLAELKLFSTMEVNELSEVLGLSAATIGREWRFAKVWLAKYLDLKVPNDYERE